MAKVKLFKVGAKYSVDSYNVRQYRGERFVDKVNVLVDLERSRSVLCYSPKYRVNVLVLRKDLVVPL